MKWQLWLLHLVHKMVQLNIEQQLGNRRVCILQFHACFPDTGMDTISLERNQREAVESAAMKSHLNALPCYIYLCFMLPAQNPQS